MSKINDLTYASIKYQDNQDIPDIFIFYKFEKAVRWTLYIENLEGPEYDDEKLFAEQTRQFDFY